MLPALSRFAALSELVLLRAVRLEAGGYSVRLR